MLIENFIILFEASAPWLLLGLLIAGLIQIFVPNALMSKQLGGEGFVSATKAALIGAPLPLCSCGVIPAALGLRKAGASRSATTSFLVATPETGVDSVTMSYALLGPFMAIVRPITAVISAIVAGCLVGKDKFVPVAKTKTHNCCSSQKTSGCGESAPSVKQQTPFWQKVTQSIQYSVTDLLAGTALWLLIGLFFAALVQTYVPSDFLAKWGSGLLAMVVMVVISIPMYICATASTPIAAGLLLSGVSPGAVLVFMMAGPATNVATLGVVGKELGKRAIAAYLIGVIGTAILFGWLTDYLVVTYGFEVAPQIGPEHDILPQWLVVGSSIALVLLMVRNVLIKYGPAQMRGMLLAK
jgi:uncharacterized membrane protein YraQ (UPF0718 family)